MSRLLQKITKKKRLLKRTNKFPRKVQNRRIIYLKTKINMGCCREFEMIPSWNLNENLFNAKRSITKLSVQLAHPERAKSQKSEKSPSEQEQEKLVIDGSSSSAFLSYENKPNWIHENQFASVSQSVSQEWMMDGRGSRSIMIAHPSFSFSFHLLSRFKLGYKGEKMEEMPL